MNCRSISSSNHLTNEYGKVEAERFLSVGNSSTNHDKILPRKNFGEVSTDMKKLSSSSSISSCQLHENRRKKISDGMVTDMAKEFIHRCISATECQRNHCNVCGIKKETYRCSACQMIYYCPQHQETDWKLNGHERNCSNLQFISICEIFRLLYRLQSHLIALNDVINFSLSYVVGKKTETYEQVDINLKQINVEYETIQQYEVWSHWFASRSSIFRRNSLLYSQLFHQLNNINDITTVVLNKRLNINDDSCLIDAYKAILTEYYSPSITLFQAYHRLRNCSFNSFTHNNFFIIYIINYKLPHFLPIHQSSSLNQRNYDSITLVNYLREHFVEFVNLASFDQPQLVYCEFVFIYTKSYIDLLCNDPGSCVEGNTSISSSSTSSTYSSSASLIDINSLISNGKHSLYQNNKPISQQFLSNLISGQTRKESNQKKIILNISFKLEEKLSENHLISSEEIDNPPEPTIVVHYNFDQFDQFDFRLPSSYSWFLFTFSCEGDFELFKHKFLSASTVNGERIIQQKFYNQFKSLCGTQRLRNLNEIVFPNNSTLLIRPISSSIISPSSITSIVTSTTTTTTTPITTAITTTTAETSVANNISSISFSFDNDHNDITPLFTSTTSSLLFHTSTLTTTTTPKITNKLERKDDGMTNPIIDCLTKKPERSIPVLVNGELEFEKKSNNPNKSLDSPNSSSSFSQSDTNQQTFIPNQLDLIINELIEKKSEEMREMKPNRKQKKTRKKSSKSFDVTISSSASSASSTSSSINESIVSSSNEKLSEENVKYLTKFIDIFIQKMSEKQKGELNRKKVKTEIHRQLSKTLKKFMNSSKNQQMENREFIYRLIPMKLKRRVLKQNIDKRYSSSSYSSSSATSSSSPFSSFSSSSSIDCQLDHVHNGDNCYNRWKKRNNEYEKRKYFRNHKNHHHHHHHRRHHGRNHRHHHRHHSQHSQSDVDQEKRMQKANMTEEKCCENQKLSPISTSLSSSSPLTSSSSSPQEERNKDMEKNCSVSQRGNDELKAPNVKQLCQQFEKILKFPEVPTADGVECSVKENENNHVKEREMTREKRLTTITNNMSSSPNGIDKEVRKSPETTPPTIRNVSDGSNEMIDKMKINIILDKVSPTKKYHPHYNSLTTVDLIRDMMRNEVKTSLTATSIPSLSSSSSSTTTTTATTTTTTILSNNKTIPFEPTSFSLPKCKLKTKENNDKRINYKQRSIDNNHQQRKDHIHQQSHQSYDHLSKTISHQNPSPVIKSTKIPLNKINSNITLTPTTSEQSSSKNLTELAKPSEKNSYDSQSVKNMTSKQEIILPMKDLTTIKTNCINEIIQIHKNDQKQKSIPSNKPVVMISKNSKKLPQQFSIKVKNKMSYSHSDPQIKPNIKIEQVDCQMTRNHSHDYVNIKETTTNDKELTLQNIRNMLSSEFADRQQQNYPNIINQNNRLDEDHSENPS
ncbi:hypothetical protein SNEBB_004630, partial [Seison nebaliae]